MGILGGIGDFLGLGPNQSAQALGGAAHGFDQRNAQVDQFGRLLSDQAMGTGPSLADAQTQRLFGQAITGQQSIAASARPGQEGLAARTAAQQAGNLQAQAAAQGALARLAERQGAQNMYGNFLLGARDQDIKALGAGAQVPTSGQALLGGAAAVAPYLMMSDERAKTEIRDGDEDANAFLSSLRPVRYRYRDEKHGAGEQVGILAQDLERSVAGRQAVVETPGGKMVDTAKLGGALAAAASRLHRRVKRLEEAT